MYKLIVAVKIRSLFAKLNVGDSEPMVRSLASRFTYVFYGDHALGGKRTTHDAMRAWWGRLFRLLPDIRFETLDVMVVGWPWSTRVATEVAVHVTLPDGTWYENIVHQFVRLRWGRVTEIRTLEDTQKLAHALQALAALGVEEATSAPITEGSVADARRRIFEKSVSGNHHEKDAIRVVHLTEERLEEAVGVLARSFQNNLNFVDLFPNERLRARALPKVQRVGLRAVLRAGRADVAIVDGSIAGVAAWLPPGAFPLSPLRQLRAAPGMISVLGISPRSARRLAKFGSAVARRHPAQPHWYLEVIGVDPTSQGLGVGERLLRAGLARVDQESEPCYLETMTERNAAWYRKHGFQATGPAVSFVPSGPPNWTMLRPPKFQPPKKQRTK